MAKSWIKTEAEISALRESSKRLAHITAELTEHVRAGVSTGELGSLAETLIMKAGGEPIFKGYGREWGAPPFPAAVCLSLNDEVVHGIPRAERVLQEGDLLKIDIGLRYRGMVSDMARTIAIGSVTEIASAVKKAAKESLEAGLSVLAAGAKMEDYARATEEVVRQYGFSAVRELVGHGVGRRLHEDPQIANYALSGLPNFTFEEGMTVALEPMVNVGNWKVRLSKDGWTFVTADGSLSAHWEDTVLITRDGFEVLTKLPHETT